MSQNSVCGLKTKRWGLLSENGETVRVKKALSIALGPDLRAAAIMARKARSDYNRVVKGLVDKEGPQRTKQAD